MSNVQRWLRQQNDVVELDRDCELGKRGERAVITEVDGKYMTVVFPNRESDRVVYTGADYLYFKKVP